MNGTVNKVEKKNALPLMAITIFRYCSVYEFACLPARISQGSHLKCT